MASAIIEYFEALNRLVEKGVKPTFDTVAIEAGRKKGSIRRGLDRHKDLVVAIDDKFLCSDIFTNFRMFKKGLTLAVP